MSYIVDKRDLYDESFNLVREVSLVLNFIEATLNLKVENILQNQNVTSEFAKQT